MGSTTTYQLVPDLFHQEYILVVSAGPDVCGCRLRKTEGAELSISKKIATDSILLSGVLELCVYRYLWRCLMFKQLPLDRRNLFGNVKLSWGSMERDDRMHHVHLFSFLGTCVPTCFYFFTHVQSVRMYDCVLAFVTLTINGGCYLLVPTNIVCLQNSTYSQFCWIVVQIILVQVAYLPTFSTLFIKVG